MLTYPHNYQGTFEQGKIRLSILKTGMFCPHNKKEQLCNFCQKCFSHYPFVKNNLNIKSTDLKYLAFTVNPHLMDTVGKPHVTVTSFSLHS